MSVDLEKRIVVLSKVCGVSVDVLRADYSSIEKRVGSEYDFLRGQGMVVSDEEMRVEIWNALIKKYDDESDGYYQKLWG